MSWPSLSLSDDGRRHSAGGHPPAHFLQVGKGGRVLSRARCAETIFPLPAGTLSRSCKRTAARAQAVCGFM